MKDDLPYFSHDNDARNHAKMKALRARFGWTGYGQFWALNEMIAGSPSARLDLSRKVVKAATACELAMTPDALDQFLEYLADPEECGLVHMAAGVLTTDRTQEDYAAVASKREKVRERKATVAKVSGNHPETSAKFPETSAKFPEENIQNRGEENRGEKNKENSSHVALPTAKTAREAPPSRQKATCVVPTPEPVPEAPDPFEDDPPVEPALPPGGFAESVFNAWDALGAAVYQPANKIAFLSGVFTRDVSPYVQHVPRGDVIQAIRNFGSIVTAPPGTVFWSARIGMGKFFKEHLAKFLPGQFNVDDWKPRPSGIHAQEDADTKAAMALVKAKERAAVAAVAPVDDWEEA